LKLVDTTTQIANLALARLGERPIESIDSTTHPAPTLNAALDPCIREVQAMFPWPELTVVWTPDPLEALTEDDYYQFTLPATCLRVLRIVDGYDYRIQGSVLCCEVEDPTVYYLQYNATPSAWGILLSQAVYYKLAIQMALPLTQNTALYRTVLQEWELSIAPALRRLASESASAVQNRPSRHNWRQARG